MILYGRNLSPFVRRVAIWCAFQQRVIERRHLSVAGDDFIEIGKHNPVARVPVLVLDDGTRLIETFSICDYLDATAPTDARLIPAAGDARMDCLQRIAVANSTSEKSVAMVYEKNRRPEEYQWPAWQDRLLTQIRGGLAALNTQAAARRAAGSPPDGGDIATIIACHFAAETNPWLLDPGYEDLLAFADMALAWPGVRETMPSV